MKVVLSPENQFIINKIYTAAHTCYSNEDPDEIYQRSLSMSQDEMLKTIKHCIDSGHTSVIEHQQLTFYISGVSRALTHQLVRKRIASYSQQSQRYCKLEKGEQFEYITPKTITKNELAEKYYYAYMAATAELYHSLIDAGIPAEDARYVLPNAVTTNITVSVNLRSLINLANERLCMCSQWEIRHLVEMMKGEVLKVLPFMKPYLQPKCELLGYCPESKKRSCGRKITKKVLLESCL